jgi:hypothetical protein
VSPFVREAGEVVSLKGAVMRVKDDRDTRRGTLR